MSSHLGVLTKEDKVKLYAYVEEIKDFIREEMHPINDDNLDGFIDFIVTKLIVYKETHPFDKEFRHKYE